MTPYAAHNALLRNAWYENPATTPTGVKSAALNALNAALQKLWASPLREEFATQQQSFSTSNGTYEYPLAAAIQPFARSIDSVKCNGRYLIEILSESSFVNRATLFSLTGTETAPRFFHVEREYAGAASTAEEARATKIWLGPTPAATYTVTFNAVLEAPQYTLAGLVDSGAVPMPDSRVESLLLPLAGWYLLASPYVLNPEVRKTLREQGRMAMAEIEEVAEPEGEEAA